MLPFFIVIGVVIVVGVISFVIYRTLHPKLKDEGKPSEEEIAKEEMDRLLQPVEDEEAAREIENFKEEDE